MQVGLLYLEMLFGQPPLYYRTIVRQSERTIIQKDLNDESTPYGGNNLTDDDRKFLLPCTDAAPGRRPWLAQLLQDPWVQEYLGWPAGWKLSEMPHGSPY
jgi:serine/threonine protein kinase